MLIQQALNRVTGAYDYKLPSTVADYDGAIQAFPREPFTDPHFSRGAEELKASDVMQEQTSSGFMQRAGTEAPPKD
jgi:hypothetical protein